VADQTEDALIREVNEDLREEQMKMLWNRFGGYVIGAAVGVVVIVAGYQGWKQYDLSNRTNEGNSFYSATLLAESGNKEAAIQAFAQLSVDSTSGYGTLAEFQQAALMADQGDVKGAAALYEKITKTNAADIAMSGLANVLGAMLEINAGDYDEAGMTMRLEAISGDSHPYRYSARELLGLVAMNAGNTALALETFTRLTEDTTTPQGTRERAKNLVQYLSR